MALDGDRDFRGGSDWRGAGRVGDRAADPVTPSPTPIAVAMGAVWAGLGGSTDDMSRSE